MPRIPLTAAAALAIMTVAASAQTTAPTPHSTLPSAAAPAPPKPAVNPLTKDVVSNIEGTAVYGGDNGKIGHVSDVLMDPQTKKIDRLVVTAGGVLGIGGHRVAIPIDQFNWDSAQGAFKLSMTTASLEKMPAWVEGSTTATGSSQPSKPLPSTGAGNSGKK